MPGPPALEKWRARLGSKTSEFGFLQEEERASRGGSACASLLAEAGTLQAPSSEERKKRSGRSGVKAGLPARAKGASILGEPRRCSSRRARHRGTMTGEREDAGGPDSGDSVPRELELPRNRDVWEGYSAESSIRRTRDLASKRVEAAAPHWLGPAGTGASVARLSAACVLTPSLTNRNPTPLPPLCKGSRQERN